jgi:hypothetical protein
MDNGTGDEQLSRLAEAFEYLAVELDGLAETDNEERAA